MVPVQYYLIVAAVVFSIGVLGSLSGAMRSLCLCVLS